MIGRLAHPCSEVLGTALFALLGGLSLVSLAAAAPRPAELRFYAVRGERSQARLVLRRRGHEIDLLTGTGAVLGQRPLGATSGIVIHGADGHIDNTLTIDLAGGPINVPRGISYDGGRGGFNTLSIRGGASFAETSTPAGPHSGVIEVDRTRVEYAEIAPILDTVPSGIFTLNPPPAGGPVLVANGPLEGGLQTMTISGGFESITIAQKAKVTVAGAGGTNSFTSDVTLAPTGMTGPLKLDGSADASNTAVFQATPPGVAVEYLGTSGDAVTVGGSGGVQSIAGPLSIDFATGSGSLTLDDSADETGRTVDVGPAQVSGLSPDAIAYARTSRLTVDGGGGSDTFDVTPSAATTDSLSGGGPVPPAFPGDQLLMELAGTTTPALLGVGGTAGTQGDWLFGNRLPVSFSGMDSLTPTAASIGNATVNPGQSGITPVTFAVDLLAPTTSTVQLPFATADGSATSAAGNYQPTSGALTFSPGETSKSLTVNVPGTTAAGPTRSFFVNLSAASGVEVLGGQAIGMIVDSNLAPLPPKITSAKQSALVWREGKQLPRIATSRRPVGSTFSFVLNEQATGTLTFNQRAPGRRVGGTCVAQTRLNHRKARCTRTIKAGTLTFTEHRGTNRVYFDGRLSATKKLRVGRYTLNIVAVNTQRQRSSPASLSFTIVK